MSRFGANEFGTQGFLKLISYKTTHALDLYGLALAFLVFGSTGCHTDDEVKYSTDYGLQRKHLKR